MSVYRCVECGHGRHLYAYAAANSYGPLASDGELERHDLVDDCYVHEDSIECERHPGAIIEKKVGHRFGRWMPCSRCRGSGRISGLGSYSQRACDVCWGKCGEWQIPDRVEVLA